jgi:hypothetical protein
VDLWAGSFSMTQENPLVKKVMHLESQFGDYLPFLQIAVETSQSFINIARSATIKNPSPLLGNLYG